MGCATVLRGAEPISPSNGVYQTLCTHISNPWIKKKKRKRSKAPISKKHDLVFYLFTLSACVRAHSGSWLLVVRNLAASVAQMVERLLLQWLLVQSLAPHLDTCALEQSTEPWVSYWSKKIKVYGELPKQHSLLQCPCYRKKRQSQRQMIFEPESHEIYSDATASRSWNHKQLNNHPIPARSKLSESSLHLFYIFT